MINIERIDAGSADFWARLRQRMDRVGTANLAVSDTVRGILDNIKSRGDAALLEYTNRFDGANAKRVADLEFSAGRLDTALRSIDATQRQALELAAHRLRSYAQRQPLESWSF